MNNYVGAFVDENRNEIVHTWDFHYSSMFGVETKNKKNKFIKILKEINFYNEEYKTNYITKSILLVNSLFPNYLKVQ